MCGILISKRTMRTIPSSSDGARTTPQNLSPRLFLHPQPAAHYGRANPQPFVDGDIVCLYNGETTIIPTDTATAGPIPLYREHGEHFARHLDGEFAVALYDFGRGVRSSPPTCSPPNCCAQRHRSRQLRSGVGGEQVPPDTTVVVDLATGEARETTGTPSTSITSTRRPTTTGSPPSTGRWPSVPTTNPSSTSARVTTAAPSTARSPAWG